jgi:hypothetical protein
MPRPKSPRGREGKRLPQVRASEGERRWLEGEALRLERTVTRVMRDRIFAPMPGYRP